jgi:hypothetical protein
MKLSKSARFILRYTPTTRLVESGTRAALRAISHAKAAGLSIHYIEDGLLIEEAPDGAQTVLKVLGRPNLPEF